MNMLLNTIKEHLGNESHLDDFTPERYIGSEVAEELLALDDMDNIEESLESSSAVILELALMDQEAALESQGLGIVEFARYEGSLGNESLTNMVKRGGYNVIIAVKKALGKIWKFFSSIVDFLFVCDGRWKSYSKLAKKYRGKLNTARNHSGENDNDKEYSIRNVAAAASFVDSVISGVSRISSFRQPTGETPSALATSTLSSIGHVFGRIFLGFERGARNNEDSAISRMFTEIVNNNTTTDSFKDRFSEIKDSIKNRVEELREAEDLSIDNAKSALISALTTIENATRRDVKWLKQFKKITKAVEKSIDKLGNERQSETSTPADARDTLLTALGQVLQTLVEAKKIVNSLMKEAGSAIQMVLADAAKVISGETRIGD